MTITASGEQIPVRLFTCPYCPKGEFVQDTESRTLFGHVATISTFRGWVAMVSTACPGDVRPSSAHGSLYSGNRQERMRTRMRGLRGAVSNCL